MNQHKHFSVVYRQLQDKILSLMQRHKNIQI